MNSQPANTYPDARIDQVLNALRTTEPPTGLEQRIAARLAQAAEARTATTSPFAAAAQPASTSPFAVILTLSLPKGKAPRISFAPAKFYSAAALTVVIALTTFTLVHHHFSANIAQVNFNSHSIPVAQSQAALTGLQGADRQPRHTSPPTNPALAADAISSPLPPSAQDPEAIALAETLAPSRPAPPMPLTAQEKLIQSATRPGQPIQLAELDLARAPHLRAAAQARENEDMERYVKSLLAPFAVADALQPTTDSQPQETPAPAPPTSNSSN
ncbi:MAG TPA: hypothetical protein VK814_01930 [Acidobacteriaceae bacterium]|jgi:hypothetical protein|nr:hypothetical protein [Acidobacteriaceae bacterium]